MNLSTLRDRSVVPDGAARPAIDGRQSWGALGHLLCALVAAVVLAQCAAAFFGLAASSFWVDELYSAWMMAGPDLADTWRRISSDVHLPVYFLLGRGWVALWGLSEWSLRLLSATFAVAAVAVLFFGGRPYLSLPARLVTAVTAVSSTFWIDQSANARMYALGLLLSSLLAVVALGIVARAGEGISGTRWAAFLAIAFATAFCHPYLFVAVGILFACLLLFLRTWRDRLIIVAGGLAIAAAMGALALLMAGHTMFYPGAMWFTNSTERFVSGLKRALAESLGWPMLLLFACGLVLLAWKRPGSAQRRGLLSLAVLLVVVALVVAIGIAASLFLTPSFSYRNVAICAPFLWLAVGFLFDLLTVRLTAAAGMAAFALCALASLANGREALERNLPRREEWRASGAYIASLPSCRGKPIPVARQIYGRVRPVFFEALRYVNGYYLGTGQTPIPVLFTEGRFGVDSQTRRIIEDRLAGRDPCPVLLWAVHVPADSDTILRAVAPGGGARMLPFPHRRWLTHTPVNDARLFVVAPR